MRNQSRACCRALSALCCGAIIGVSGGALGAQSARAATTVACSNVWASGSTLQTPAQQNDLPQLAGALGAFANCSSAPSISYNFEADGTTPYPDGGTGSGAALSEFALASPFSLYAADSADGEWLDGFVGTDVAPDASALQSAAGTAGTDAEVVPVLQAPIAIVVHLPTACTVTAQPTVTNLDLLHLWEGDAITWEMLLTDAKAKPVGSGCGAAITLEARSDSAGETEAFRQYLYQLSELTHDGVYTTAQINPGASSWPSSVTVSEASANGPNDGSGALSEAVEATAGSMGYVDAASAAEYHGFGKWTKGTSEFWVKLQNNGIATSKVTGGEPQNGNRNAACYVIYQGPLPSSTVDPDWSNTFVANPSERSPTAYPLCALTFDVAWHSYLAAQPIEQYYNANYTGETATGVEDTVRDYLTWLTAHASAQGAIPPYYTELPTTIQKFASTLVKNEVAVN
jgi:ABC-type phosphate transport system substrate-binding protein